MSFIKLSRIFLPISGLLVLASLVAFFIYPRPIASIEFTGGTQMELSIPQGKSQDDLAAALRTYQLNGKPLEGEISQTKTGSYFVRVPTLTNDQHAAAIAALQKALGGKVTELQYTTIGPTVGENLKQSSFWALSLACLFIMLFIAFAFRKITRGLNPWSMGVATILAMIHDISILVGIFTILSHITTFQMDTLFVTALLTIMGHSVNDKIIIFDRIRETVGLSNKHESMEEVVNRALNAVVSRTINTGLAILFMLTALFLLGSESIRWFVLALMIGTVLGMYSSYFVATDLVLYWRTKK